MSTDAPLRLYMDRFWISPYAFSCFVTLKEKGVPFETIEIGLDRRDQHRPDYRDRSITAKVPALEHGDLFLAESSAIVEYLEEAFAPPHHPAALPARRPDRARARQIMSWIRSDLLPLREERPTTTMFYEPAPGALSDRGEAAARYLLRVANRLVPEGATSLFGAWSTADTDLAFMLHRLILNGYPVQGKVRAFADAVWSRPSVRAFVEKKRAPYVPY
jgi:glutathione S-transferase